MTDLNRTLAQVLAINFDAAEQKAIQDAIVFVANNGATSRFSVPMLGLYAPGNYISVAPNARASIGSATGSDGVMDLMPFAATERLDISEVGNHVQTGTPGTGFQVLVYDSDGPYGYAGTRLYKSGTISAESAGWAGEAANLVLEAGRLYWIGMQYSGAPILGGRFPQEMLSIGVTSNTGNEANALRKSTTFGQAPESWGFLTSDLTAVTAPNVRMRIRPL